MFLIQFYPSRKKRARTADFSCPTTLIKPRQIAIGRSGSPLHAESVAPTGVVALPENLASAIFFRRVCRRFPWFSFPGRHGFRTTPSSCDLCQSSLAVRVLAFSFLAF